MLRGIFVSAPHSVGPRVQLEMSAEILEAIGSLFLVICSVRISRQKPNECTLIDYHELSQYNWQAIGLLSMLRWIYKRDKSALSCV